MPNNFDYNLGIPAGPNNPSSDQPLMQINTDSIANLISIDHIGFGVDGGGIHEQCTFPTSTVDPGLGDGTGVLFGKIPSGGTDNYPFWKNSTGVFQLAGVTTNSSNGKTTLPGGIIMQWGSITGSPISSGATITFPTVFTSLYSLTISGTTSIDTSIPVTINDSNVTTAGFKLLIGGVSPYKKLFWIAIGA